MREAANCQHRQQHIPIITITTTIDITYPQHTIPSNKLRLWPRQHSRPIHIGRGTNQIYRWHPRRQQQQLALAASCKAPKVVVSRRQFRAPFRQSPASRPTNHGHELEAAALVRPISPECSRPPNQIRAQTRSKDL